MSKIVKQINNIRIVENKNKSYDCIAPDGKSILMGISLDFAESICKNCFTYINRKKHIKTFDRKTCMEIEKRIESLGISVEGVDFSTDGRYMRVYVSWGDWKHSHLYLKGVLEKLYNLKHISEDITEEDGSDCYSAEHTFVIEG